MNFNPHVPAPQLRGIIFGFSLSLPFFSVAFAADKEIEITSFYAKVYVAPSTNANFIGLTQKGERYPILGIRDTWYYIRFKNANGWVDSSHLRIIDPDAPVVEATTEPLDTESMPRGKESVDSSPATPAAAGAKAGIPPTTVPVASQDSERVTAAASTATTTASRSPSQRRSTQRRRTTPHSTKKKESRLRSWFTQQNLPDLPPTIVPDEEQATTTGGDPSLSSIDFSCAGASGYVDGTIDNMPSGSWHVRSWVKTNKYYPQSKDLSPEQDGDFSATGLWCTPGPGVDIYVTMHLASTDECGTGNCDQVDTNDWPDEISPDYIFGPFSTE